MNRKLMLDVDTLSVKSFDTEEKPAEVRGTVKAREVYCRWSEPTSCDATLHTCASFDRGC